MEYYLVTKNKNFPFTTTGMDLKGIMLSEISQTEKDKDCMISHMCEIIKKKMNKQNRNRLIDAGNKLVVTRCSRGWGEGLGGRGKGIKKYKLVVTK